jgi:hypothetical protein
LIVNGLDKEWEDQARPSTWTVILAAVLLAILGSASALTWRTYYDYENFWTGQPDSILLMGKIDNVREELKRNNEGLKVLKQQLHEMQNEFQKFKETATIQNGALSLISNQISDFSAKLPAPVKLPPTLMPPTSVPARRVPLNTSIPLPAPQRTVPLSISPAR